MSAWRPLLPAEGAPAMWSLNITEHRLTSGAGNTFATYVVTLEGPDATLHVDSEVRSADGVPLSGITDRFLTIEDATAGGITAFAAMAGPDDILVPVVDEEWPLVAPDDVLREAEALRERGLLATWACALARYRQWTPGQERDDQRLVVVRDVDGWTVDRMKEQ